MKSYSQSGEDLWIWENLKPKQGIVFEIGAFDGVMSSNSLLFEEQGWDCVLVEADPYLAGKCQLNRKGSAICCACGTPSMDSQLAVFSINSDDRGLSGLTQAWDKVILVPTLSLHQIIRSTGKEPTILSIDTEGTELDVWNSRGGFDPEIVIMEYQTRDLPSTEADIVTEMTRDRYLLVHKTPHNLIFKRDYGSD